MLDGTFLISEWTGRVKSVNHFTISFLKPRRQYDSRMGFLAGCLRDPWAYLCSLEMLCVVVLSPVGAGDSGAHRLTAPLRPRVAPWKRQKVP